MHRPQWLGPHGWAALALAAVCAALPASMAPADSLPQARLQPPRPAHAADREAARALDAAAATAHTRFGDIASWLQVWDDPQPAAAGEPERVIELLRLRPGMRLVLLGAATGYFNARLSRAVGPAGVVYAVDADSELVRGMRVRAVRERTPNVLPVLEVNGVPQLPVASVDRVLLVDGLHHRSDRSAYCKRLQGALGANGLLVIVEWLPGELARGPSAAWKIAPWRVSEELRAIGYRLVQLVELRYHDVLVFRVADPGEPSMPR